MNTSNPVDWRNHATCLGDDPNRWIRPVRGGNQDHLRRICHTCPVQLHCLAHALAYNEPVGIWGGTSERERRILRRALRAITTGQLATTTRPPLPGFPPDRRPPRPPSTPRPRRPRPPLHFDGQLTIDFPPTHQETAA